MLAAVCCDVHTALKQPSAAVARPTGTYPPTCPPTCNHPQVLTEPELVARSEAFGAAIRGGDREALSAFCSEREAALEGSEEAETWAFLQTHFAPDGRKFLLQRLGFADYLPAEAQPDEQPAAEGEAAAAAEGDAAAAAGDQLAQLGLEQQAAAERLLADDGADFFANSPQGAFGMGWVRACSADVLLCCRMRWRGAVLLHTQRAALLGSLSRFGCASCCLPCPPTQHCPPLPCTSTDGTAFFDQLTGAPSPPRPSHLSPKPEAGEKLPVVPCSAAAAPLHCCAAALLPLCCPPAFSRPASGLLLLLLLQPLLS